MKPINFIYSLLALLYSTSGAAGIFNNSYLSIKNNVESNLYIGPLTANNNEPLIAGASHITYPTQTLFAYARIACANTTNVNDPCAILDYWWSLYEPNPFVSNPYLGPVCHIDRPDGCTSDGVMKGFTSSGVRYPQFDSTGLWTAANTSTAGFNPYYGFVAGKLSMAYLEALHNVPTGNTVTITQTQCRHQFVLQAGDTSKCGNFNTNTLNFKKAGTLTLNPVDRKNDIFVDSDGTPTLLPGAQGCEAATVAGISGLICELSSYNFEAQGWPTTNPFSYALRITNGALNARVAVEDIKISTDKVNWTGKEVAQSINTLQNGNNIYVFLSKNYFKALNDTGLLGSNERVLRFSFFHAQMTASGYYEFAPSVRFDVKSRYYSVFITPESGSYAEGKVGVDRLRFPYRLVESGPASASRLELRVSQDTGTVFNGLCTLYQGNIAIPVPTRLVFNSESLGDNHEQPIRCDATPVNLRLFQIKDAQPPEYWQGVEGAGVTRYYNVNLDFDLRDPMVFNTTMGEPWEGTATQTGKIELRAIWE